MKKTQSLLCLSFLFATTTAFAQIETIKVPAVNLTKTRIQDQKREADRQPPRYAIPFSVDVSPTTHGKWAAAKDGQVWKIRVEAPGAKSVNLGFAEFRMPEGGSLRLIDENGNAVLRAFTSADNEEHGQLWTPPVAGSSLTLEVSVPAERASELKLRLTQIGSGYRGFSKKGWEKASGSCNVDVVCQEGNDWRDQIQSVAVISTGGSTFCTGFLVNNTARDKKMYFMTAAHCGITAQNAASLVAIWNYYNSTCRAVGSSTSGGSGNGNASQFNTGAIFKATFRASDFTLVELDDAANPAHGLYFAGWDASGKEAKAATAIHHPNTDEKRISFEYQETTTTAYGQNAVPGDSTHVRVIDWDLGTTEPGSSGSPLFDHNKRIIGQLHGGGAACGNDLSDWYGRISASWKGGGAAASALKFHLDARNTGEMFIDGMK